MILWVIRRLHTDIHTDMQAGRQTDTTSKQVSMTTCIQRHRLTHIQIDKYTNSQTNMYTRTHIYAYFLKATSRLDSPTNKLVRIQQPHRQAHTLTFSSKSPCLMLPPNATRYFPVVLGSTGGVNHP